MKIGTALLLSLALCTPGTGCNRNQADQAPPPSAGPSGGPPAAGPAPAATEPAATEPAAAPASAPSGSLPRAADVLPAGEVSGESLAVIGDGYRFQIKPQLKPVPHPLAGTAYSGTIDGTLDPAELTLYVLHEPFTGDLAALTKRQTEAVRAAGGKVSVDGPVKVLTAGSLSGDGYRFLAILKDKLDEQILTVHDGTAWVFHAETPNTPNSVANMGADLVIRGSTFHVDPPRAKDARP